MVGCCFSVAESAGTNLAVGLHFHSDWESTVSDTSWQDCVVDFLSVMKVFKMPLYECLDFTADAAASLYHSTV